MTLTIHTDSYFNGILLYINGRTIGWMDCTGDGLYDIERIRKLLTLLSFSSIINNNLTVYSMLILLMMEGYPLPCKNEYNPANYSDLL